MSDLTLPAPTPPEPPGRDRRIAWTALASVMLHAGVLVFLLWQPLPDSAEAAQPPAIDVELVPPPEAVSASEPPPSEEPSEAASAEPATAAPAETAAAEPPPAEQAAAPAPEAAEASAPEMPVETEVPKTAAEADATAAPSASEPTASAASEPPRGSEASAKVAPMPLPRPKVRGLTAPSSAPDDGAPALTADTGGAVEGTAPAATPDEPDVATLELGAQRSAERFYLEAMLSTPSMERAREMIKTLQREKRVAQSCNLEALAQIGNAGEGFAPDVVMAEAYARSEMTGTRLVADGAIFRSQEKWYGVAFDCTLSDDLTSVTAFSYRLGADVTEAVLARLGKT